MYRRQLFVIPLVVLFAGADDAKQDAESLQGTWTLVEVVRGGKKESEEKLKQMTAVIKGDTLTFMAGDRPGEKVKLVFDATKKPKAVDMVPDTNEKEEKPSAGIYELNGDTLKFCWNKQSSVRPTEFTSQSGDRKSMLFVLKRDRE